MTSHLNEIQLDALRELANIASGIAATALSHMLGQEVGINLPRALALPFAEAVEACGAPEAMVAGVVIPLEGDVEGLVLLLIPTADADMLCRRLGVEPRSDVGDSALCEIGNILGTSYLNGLSAMTGMYLGPCPPHLTIDRLGIVVATLLAATAEHADSALLLDSELRLADDPCSITFVLLPTTGGVSDLLAPLGLDGGL